MLVYYEEPQTFNAYDAYVSVEVDVLNINKI